ncbi:hypothetical protein JXO59_01785, partial [candidate division KSB1 bacterium]|nr:hypothetical protein [candidate division KSB1 bacterium]
MTDPKPQKFNMITPLGLMIQRPSKNQYCIDLDQITVLGDITSFVDDLVHEIADQCVWGLTDIMAQKRIDNDKLPGLAALGVFNICFYARLTVVDDFLQLKHVIHKRLCAILFALQMEKWQALLFTRPTRSAKSSTAHSSALMVPMDGNELTGLFFLIEAEPVSKFLRITLERASDNRLRLSRIPHSKLDAGNLPDGELDAM